MKSIKSCLMVLVGVSVFVYATAQCGDQKPTTSPNRIQKLLVVMTGPNIEERGHYEQVFQKTATRFATQQAFVFSESIMPNLAILKKAKQLQQMAAQNQIDGILIVTITGVGTEPLKVCQRSGSIVVDTLLPTCSMVDTAYLSYEAQLRSAETNQELWKIDDRIGGNPLKPGGIKDLLQDVDIHIIKKLQKDKFIAPPRFR